ncbi:MAG: uracil-DNA glycosylase family protein, partial [Methanococcaceae archaeon]
IIRSIRNQLKFGIINDLCFCMGTGKNARYLTELNEREHFFGKIVPLEHPRFVMQYRTKRKQEYIDKYMQLLKI